MTDPGAPGTRFGHRVVIAPAPAGWQKDKGLRPRVLTRCDCGREHELYVHNLVRGASDRCVWCANRRPPAGDGIPDPEPVDEAKRGERCGYRPQCPPDGSASCHYYLPRYDLCCLTVADLGGLSTRVVAEVEGVSRARVQQIEERAPLRRVEALRAIDDDGFELGKQWHASTERMVRRRMG